MLYEIGFAKRVLVMHLINFFLLIFIPEKILKPPVRNFRTFRDQTERNFKIFFRIRFDRTDYRILPDIRIYIIFVIF